MKNKKILIIITIVGYLLLVGVLTSIIAFFRNQDQFFFNLATAVMLSWIITIIIFYIWSIYYFHVYLAVEDEEEGISGQFLSNGEKKPIRDKLMKNPHVHETLGLPEGTIRGTIALSLLIAGLCLLIASFEMDQTFQANALFVDNFEFIKTAFLMVIAFYFGHKSIAAITGGKRGVYRPGEEDPNPAGQNPSSQGIGTNHDNVAPPLPVNSQFTALKNTLKHHGNAETTDSGTTNEFDDHEAVG